MMGGEISVRSTEGTGSTFEFSLRLGMQDACAQAADAVDPSPCEAFAGQPVLVVDDNARCRNLMCAYLDSWGMRPETTESAAAALARIATARAAGKPYRLVLFDGTLPDADAFELAAETTCDATAVVVLADTTQGPAIAAARAHRQVHALIKPVSQSTLHDAVAVLLDLAIAQPDNTAECATPEAAPAQRGLDILLVEDNAVNRKLATRLLEKMGHRVTEAHDGAAAVAAHAAHAYDAILMDMQMPVMDGLEATRAIRARETGSRHVPIIALTGNAMGGDRDRCIAAGMDDYVSKPIEVAALVAALDRQTAGCGIASPAPAAAAAGDAKAVPAEYNRAEALNRAAGDEELLAQIVGIFLQETPALLENIGTYLDAGDHERAFRAAHTLKGSSANLSASAVSSAARTLELAARHGDIGAARAAYPQLQSATAVLVERLAAEFGGAAAARMACEATS